MDACNKYCCYSDKSLTPDGEFLTDEPETSCRECLTVRGTGWVSGISFAASAGYTAWELVNLWPLKFVVENMAEYAPPAATAVVAVVSGLILGGHLVLKCVDGCSASSGEQQPLLKQLDEHGEPVMRGQSGAGNGTNPNDGLSMDVTLSVTVDGQSHQDADVLNADKPPSQLPPEYPGDIGISQPLSLNEGEGLMTKGELEKRYAKQGGTLQPIGGPSNSNAATSIPDQSHNTSVLDLPPPMHHNLEQHQAHQEYNEPPSGLPVVYPGDVNISFPTLSNDEGTTTRDDLEKRYAEEGGSLQPIIQQNHT